MDSSFKTSPHSDRRAFSRVPVQRPARLITAVGYRSVDLCNLSRGGARLLLDGPPALGTTALLRWDNYEVLCTVAWSSEMDCGVVFEKLVAEEVVEETAAAPSRSERPGGGVTKIEFGKKRRALIVSNEHRPTPDRHNNPRCWSLVLPRRSGGDALSLSNVTAAEELFFFGSPLAHVVCFDGYQRSNA
jgi:hypothetical protein